MGERAYHGPILRGVARYSGDGWKDSTRQGDVVFVYGSSLPPPYAAGQFPCVGCTIWSATIEQFEFRRATLWERIWLLPKIWRDRKPLGHNPPKATR